MAKKWDITHVPDLVNQIYNQVLERDVDNVGLLAYGCQLSQGQISIRDAVKAIGLSDEYASKFINDRVDRDQVELCYKHFLSRLSDPTGLDSNLALLRESGINAVIVAMINSPEYTQAFGEDTVPHPR